MALLARRIRSAIALASLLLLAAAAPPQPGEMTREKVDAELHLFVAQARAGYLLHPITHAQCGHRKRTRKIAALNREYLLLEGEYRDLGGTFLSDEEQSLRVEGTHTICADRRTAGAYFRVGVASAQAGMDRARMLLRRKRELVAISGGPAH